MEPQPASPSLTDTVRPALALTGVLVALTLLPVVGAAASQNTGCNEPFGQAAPGLDIPARKLALEIVEHMVIIKKGDFDSVPEEPELDVASAKVTPVLLLTPRVASIMREVFDSDVQSGADAEPPEPAESDGTGAARSVSPVADGRRATPDAVTAPPGSEGGVNQYVPRFQRQMYRTDI